MVAMRRGYRRYDDDFKRMVVAESYASDASVIEVSSRHDVLATRLYAWRGDVRFQPDDDSVPGSDFVSVTIDSETGSATEAPTVRSFSSDRIEIMLENGRCLSVSDGVDAEFVLVLARGLAA